MKVLPPEEPALGWGDQTDTYEVVSTQKGKQRSLRAGVSQLRPTPSATVAHSGGNSGRASLNLREQDGKFLLSAQEVPGPSWPQLGPWDHAESPSATVNGTDFSCSGVCQGRGSGDMEAGAASREAGALSRVGLGGWRELMGRIKESR